MKFSGPTELTKGGQLKNMPYKGYQRTTIGHDLFKFKPFQRHPITVSYKSNVMK
jgi:hypothetical protein